MTDTPTTQHDDALIIAAGWTAAPKPDDAAKIQNLIQVYALYSDAGRADELSRLFTADAEWDGRDLGYGLSRGADAIGASVAGHYRVGQPMMHLPGPPVLSAVADDEVHGVSWCLATRWADGNTAPHIHFYYEDVIRRADDGQWRFARRRLRRAFPPSPS